MRALKDEESHRYYMPWDPLQLSTDIDSGSRINKAEVHFQLFRTFKRLLLWISLRDKNLAIFSNDNAEVLSVLTRMIDLSDRKFHKSVRIAFFDMKNELNKELLELDRKNRTFTYHPYDEDFEHLIGEIEEHCNVIRTESNGNEPPNKMLQFLMIRISTESSQKLQKDEALQARLLSLLSNAHYERVYLAFVIEDIESFPLALYSNFSQAFFLGDENMNVASEELYPDWRITKNSFRQKLVGFGVVDGRSELVSLHPGVYTPSGWAMKHDESVEKEERLYREFLESLEA